MNLILLGPPGTGKGTIAKYVEKTFSATHISTGDLLRDQVTLGTELGKRVESIMNLGALVDDHTVLECLRAKLDNVKGGFILDGFPRNENQAKMLDGTLNDLNIKIDLVLQIETPDEEILKRLAARRQCIKCNRIYGMSVPPWKSGVCDNCGSEIILRKDDQPEVVKERLRVYHEVTGSLPEYYEKQGLLKNLNGNRPLEEIYKDIDEILKNYQ